AVSIIVACEVRYGLVRKGSPRLTQGVETLLQHLNVLPLTAPVDAHYADIRHGLEQRGLPIGHNDLLIAAHARALGLCLLTDNMREFARVPGLAVDNWLRCHPS
ncbi:MAG: PIN domain-containing protein, partial [Polyangiales bacterium]